MNGLFPVRVLSFLCLLLLSSLLTWQAGCSSTNSTEISAEFIQESRPEVPQDRAEAFQDHADGSQTTEHREEPSPEPVREEDAGGVEWPGSDVLPEPGAPTSWVVALGEGAENILGTQIAVDSLGAVYIAGRFQGKTRLGNQILQAPKDLDAFISKLSPTGQVAWTIHLAGDGIQEIRDLQVSPTGHITATGTFSRELRLHGKSYLVAQGGCFVFQLDQQGQLRWFVQAGGVGADVGQSLTHDRQGNVYVLGVFNGPAQFGTFRIATQNFYDLFIARLTPEGTFQWVTTTTGSATSTAASISLDTQGNIVIVGQYVVDIQLGRFQLTSQQMDMVVAGLNPQGQFTWATSTQGSGLAVPHHVRVDAQGYAYVVGEVEGEKSFGTHTLKQPGHGDIFLARLTPQGSFQWVRQNGGTNVHIHPYGMVLNTQQHPVIAGEYTGRPSFGSLALPTTNLFQAFMVQATPDGSFAWAFATPNANAVHGRKLAIDQDNNLYLIGEFDTSAGFGSQTVTPGNQQTYLFVWKYPQP